MRPRRSRVAAHASRQRCRYQSGARHERSAFWSSTTTLFREGLTVLTSVPDVQVVGQKPVPATEAIAQAENLAPDVILMDINMPDLNGIEATQQVLAAAPARPASSC
ncbi:MAG: response regulator transcription factor [Caldilineaceae bacterium]